MSQIDNYQVDNYQVDNHQIDHSRISTKTSIGIILCRKNVNTGRPEVLLAHKRYTYAFADFVHGKYVRSRIGSNTMLRYIAPLFDHMTREELFDILSLNFEQMWYRIWLTTDNKDLYNKKYAKFQSTFMRDDQLVFFYGKFLKGASLTRAKLIFYVQLVKCMKKLGFQKMIIGFYQELSVKLVT
jgi:hypothetical protein